VRAPHRERYAGYDEQNGRTEVRSAAGAIRGVGRVDENDGRRIAGTAVGQTLPSSRQWSAAGLRTGHGEIGQRARQR